MSYRSLGTYLALGAGLFLGWSISKHKATADRTVCDERAGPGGRQDVPRAGKPPAIFMRSCDLGSQLEERARHRQERPTWDLSKVLNAIIAASAVISIFFSNRTLKEASRATREAHQQAEQAKRQADYAEPRAWVYIELTKPNSFVLPVITQRSDGKRDIIIGQSISLRNYGSIPATINQVQVTIIIPNSLDTISAELTDPVHVDKNFSSIKLDSRAKGFDQGFEDLQGKIVAGNASAIESSNNFFIFRAQNDIKFHNLRKKIYIKVFYSDPYGERLACYFGSANAMYAGARGNREYNDCK